jgi:DNA-binding SARP family transcriptional activator
VYFRILGPLEVVEGERLLALGGPRQRALLAILLLRVNEVVSTDRLADQLWGETPPPSAAKAIQVYVSKLRKQLGENRLVTRAPGYVLLADSSELDLGRFEQLVSKARSAEPEEAAALLREALALWRGAPLADLEYEAFAQAEISRLDELRLAVLEERIDADLATGRNRETLGELESLVVAHPLRERLAGQLMLALYRSGRQAEALDAYQTARRTLVDEIGLEPTPALQRLERRILQQDPDLELPVRAETSTSTDPGRALLVVPLDPQSIDPLLALAAPLASEPARELILMRLLQAGESESLPYVTEELGRLRDDLRGRRISARVAAFTSSQPTEDIVRLATEQAVDLVFVDGVLPLLESLPRGQMGEILRASPADVAVLVAGSHRAFASDRPVLVPFGAAQHDWAALELGSWLARASGAPLKLLGALSGDGRPEVRDASRLLADASLLVQQFAGVVAEPLLTKPGPDELLQASTGSGVVIVGLSDRWAAEGLGPVRRRLALEAPAPVVFVHRGLRPGGLAPSQTRTRFTWSMAGAGA